MGSPSCPYTPRLTTQSHHESCFLMLLLVFFLLTLVPTKSLHPTPSLSKLCRNKTTNNHAGQPWEVIVNVCGKGKPLDLTVNSRQTQCVNYTSEPSCFLNMIKGSFATGVYSKISSPECGPYTRTSQYQGSIKIIDQ